MRVEKTFFSRSFLRAMFGDTLSSLLGGSDRGGGVFRKQLFPYSYRPPPVVDHSPQKHIKKKKKRRNPFRHLVKLRTQTTPPLPWKTKLKGSLEPQERVYVNRARVGGSLARSIARKGRGSRCYLADTPAPSFLV